MPCVEEEPFVRYTTLIVCAGKVKPLSALIAASSQDVMTPLKMFATVQAESLMSPVLTPGRLTKTDTAPIWNGICKNGFVESAGRPKSVLAKSGSPPVPPPAV